MSLWDDLKKQTKEWSDVAIDKSQELSKIGKLKLEIVKIQKNIDREFSALGGLAYELIKQEKTTELTNNEGVKSSVARITELENELEEKKKQLEEPAKEEDNEIEDQEAPDDEKEE